jgi:hypothetical protein
MVHYDSFQNGHHLGFKPFWVNATTTFDVYGIKETH